MSDSNEEDRVEVPDYSGEAAPVAQDSMKRLTRLVIEMGQLEIQKQEMETKLESVNKELREYQENLVPALMGEIGLSQVKTQAGIVVELREEVRASFPKDDQKRATAFAYLEREGDDGIVKRQFTIRYGRDSIEWANKFHEELQKLGVAEHATIDEDWSIHHQTLLSYLRQKLKEGSNVPLEAFGAFVQSFARIKL